MVNLKFKEIIKMGKNEMNEKLKELRFELIKANVTANKTNAKTKEIKRAIARLMTYFNTVNGRVLKTK
ncbi:MAG: 50S ribosomal protein L29 [Nanoarchaeota archaeon]